MLEIELKAALEGMSSEEVLHRAQSCGFVPCEQVRETDIYFNGNQRDFRRTDEALRLRSLTVLPDGPCESLLTYKGPKLDQISNTRTEHETAVADGETAKKLLEALGYRPVFTVDKTRYTYRLDDVTLCMDDVVGLGKFVELETLAASEECRETSVARLLTLLDRLGVDRKRLTRRSYLEMLLRRQASTL